MNQEHVLVVLLQVAVLQLVRMIVMAIVWVLDVDHYVELKEVGHVILIVVLIVVDHLVHHNVKINVQHNVLHV